MLTSLGNQLDAEEMKAAGIEACVLKPVKQQRLFNPYSGADLGRSVPFGISAVARKTPTAETQLLAHVKRLATRKARGTRGKRQRLKIKGADVRAVTVSADGSTVTDDSPAATPVAVAAAPGG